MSNLVTLQFTDQPIAFRDDGWFNATQAAAIYGKRPNDWLALDETKEYIAAAITGSDGNCRTAANLVQTKRGANGGTWLHPRLAVPFGRWLNVRFAVWCDEQIHGLLFQRVDHRQARHEAAASCKVMNAILQATRDTAGKPTAAHHYINEARLVNWALAGEFAGLDRDSLSATDLDLLAKLEERNAVLIGTGSDYASRKSDLRQFANDWRAMRQPALPNVA